MPTFGLRDSGGTPITKPSATPAASTPARNNGGAIQSPGNNLVNPGYSEQAFEYTQNRLMEDPYGSEIGRIGAAASEAGTGERYLAGNLGSLQGPGQGQQYWNQVQGQYMDPFAGEQYTREATQNFSPQGAAGAFNQQAMADHYGTYTNYSTGNAQGQYGQSAGQLAGGTQGEQGLGQIAGQYGAIGQYGGPNNAQGQYQQNASYGPMAAQSFFDQVGGSYGQMGQYQDPNRAAGQYEQTQQAFGDLPIANFDPFYDRAIQLGTQDYNRQTAGRGVYGSSEALSGVGNIITDLNAQRANRSFDAEMQRAQEQRARQQLLGEQARMGDLSGLGAFSANMQGLETYGNLANNAGNQTLNQQTMLGNQARNADISATDAFDANLRGASTFADINNALASQELGRHELLGSMANNADTQATSAQNARTDAMAAFGTIANNADRAETDRYTASTNAMYNADRMGLDRMNSGADIAFGVDDQRRQNYDSEARAAEASANIRSGRLRDSANILDTASDNDLDRLRETNDQAGNAERDRQSRQIAKLNAVSGMSKQVQSYITDALQNFDTSGQGDWENYAQSELVPALQEYGLDQKQIDQILEVATAYAKSKSGG